MKLQTQDVQEPESAGKHQLRPMKKTNSIVDLQRLPVSSATTAASDIRASERASQDLNQDWHVVQAATRHRASMYEKAPGLRAHEPAYKKGPAAGTENQTKYPAVLQLAQQEVAPESIPMEIRIQDKIVQFQYILKTDSPEQVLNELLQQKKLDSQYQSTFMHQINETLEFYENARKRYLQNHPKQKQQVD